MSLDHLVWMKSGNKLGLYNLHCEYHSSCWHGSVGSALVMMSTTMMTLCSASRILNSLNVVWFAISMAVEWMNFVKIAYDLDMTDAGFDFVACSLLDGTNCLYNSKR